MREKIDRSQENEMDQIIDVKFFTPDLSLFAQYIGHFAQDKRLSKTAVVMWFTVAS